MASAFLQGNRPSSQNLRQWVPPHCTDKAMVQPTVQLRPARGKHLQSETMEEGQPGKDSDACNRCSLPGTTARCHGHLPLAPLAKPSQALPTVKWWVAQMGCLLKQEGGRCCCSRKAQPKSQMLSTCLEHFQFLIIISYNYLAGSDSSSAKRQGNWLLGYPSYKDQEF